MQPRTALQELILQKRNTRDDFVRFIPYRSAMDFEYVHYLLTEGGEGVKKPGITVSASSDAYQKRLVEALHMNRTRILAFKKKPPTLDGYGMIHCALDSALHFKPTMKKRHISLTVERTLDAPEILVVFYLNLLDWGCNNVLAIALNATIYLWDASNGSVSELVTVNDEDDPVTSASWAPDGWCLAVGLNDSHVQLWDCQVKKQLITLRGGHRCAGRVGALACNNQILTTGGMDARIVNNDVRRQEHIVECYRGHQLEVCGLKWSSSGQQLTSGGNDNRVFFWDRCSASSNSRTQWLHRLEDHTAAVKALAWCPFQVNLLASGGGGGDQRIRFWNTHSGACLNSVDTGSEVCALLWNKNEHELLSAHGFPNNQIILWTYPSMKTMAQLHGHKSEVFYMAESPNGCTVATAAWDETLLFWNVFGAPDSAKPSRKLRPEPFANVTLR